MRFKAGRLNEMWMRERATPHPYLLHPFIIICFGVRAGNDHGWSGWRNSSPAGPYTPPPTKTDYDTDDDGLIEISSVAQLDAIRYDTDGNGMVSAGDRSSYQAAYPNPATNMGCPNNSSCIGYELSTDLDLSDWDWLPIDAGDGYSATFDGNDFTISNLYIDLPTTDDVGLFGSTTPSALIRNVVLSAVSVTGSDFVGSLIGSNHGTITDSTSSGNVTGNNDIGGLVGINNAYGTITDSTNSGNVTGNEYVGGLTGSSDGTITDSTNSGNVTGSDYVGGLTGSSGGNDPDMPNTITGSTNSGNVTGKEYVGGLVGSNGGTITDSTNNGDVTANDYVGGLVGSNDGTITNSTNNGDVTASHYVGGLVGSNGGNDSDMPNAITDSTATGNVTAFKYYGALVGSNNGTITNSNGTGTLTQLPGVASASVTDAGLVSWEYELDDGVSFRYVQVRWIEKPANDAPINWGNATKHLIWNANTSSYQIPGLTAGTEYVVRLFIGLSQNGAFKQLKTDAGPFTP